MRSSFVTLCAIALISSACGFYLPGVAPREFKEGDELRVRAQSLISTKTQLPYEYYSLQFCKPDKLQPKVENLGEVLRGDRIQNSPYTLKMHKAGNCFIACKVAMLDDEVAAFAERVNEGYRVQLILDNLPVAVRRYVRDEKDPKKTILTYVLGYALGRQSRDKKGAALLNNHLSFTVLYHEDAAAFVGARIVGFEVEPYSVKHEYEKEITSECINSNTCVLKTCDKTAGLTATAKPLHLDRAQQVVFTYDVKFEPSPTKWASRWDTYLMMTDDQIHWFSIINSLMIVLFLTGMVAMIMMRTLHNDFRRYNQLETSEDIQEETGWKLLHGEVFRPPQRSSLLAALVGTGAQILCMSVTTLVFALLGFLSPANRGALMTAVLFLFVFLGAVAGYVSARVYKSCGGVEWKQNTLLVALGVPGIVFSIFFVLNFFIWGEESSGAVPFGTLIAIVLMWFAISTPLVFVGAFFGFKKPAIEYPCKTLQIPRHIPEQPWYMRPVISILIGGVLPFGAVFFELLFILTSVWLHRFYYIFGFLFIVFCILVITCAEITIVLCYFQLCSEDYKWWWRSFLTVGSTAGYLFFYSVFYFYSKLDLMGYVASLIYFSHMFVVSLVFFCMCGSVGFLSALWFVRKIYGAIKVD